MEFKESIITCLTKYADFKGRASRSEYWWFWLFTLLVTLGASILNPSIGSVAQLALLLPSIAVGVRRMHDTNHNGWYLIIPLYNLFLACQPSETGANEYGQKPNK